MVAAVEVLLITCTIAIIWFACYVVYRLVTDDSPRR
ncbi:hypothetical protein DFR75_10980 [Nocardia ignorata]|uniref:Uncharacterized protein n=1 Tax=Nocardia ignorata TaxID=145285 RepID=A0A4R6P105_NOCIG|nr:hypothetical protein DFR75_10980 [Nocardia ignorata]